ncbi:MAG TPA: hypothetical protein DHW82_07220, partial [Spirochaetia bacterium]|nr:hypothetical protein [Spirochaetia bacterium]
MELQTLYTKEDSDKILSEIKKNLNPRKELDFNKVLDIAFQDLREKFKFESINVFLLNKAHTHLIPYRLHNPFLPEETTRKLYQMPIPLQEESGITSYIIQKKMNIYIPEIKPEMIFSEWSKEVFRLTKMKSNLMFPLFIDEAVCGIITFPTFDKTLALIEEQIKDVNNYVFYISIALTSMFYSIELKEKSKIIERKNHQMRE